MRCDLVRSAQPLARCIEPEEADVRTVANRRVHSRVRVGGRATRHLLDRGTRRFCFETTGGAAAAGAPTRDHDHVPDVPGVGGLALEQAAALPDVRGDRMLLREALLNVVSNAAEACANGGGEVKVQARAVAGL